ncbi:hypothetical protein Tco_1498698, partial [Tanacetum coccineum]
FCTVVMCSISGINRCVGFVCSAFGSAWFGIIMSGYTSALQITNVFGCLVTRLLYRLQMCLVPLGSHYSAWLHIANVFGSSFALVCMHLFGLPQIKTSSSTESAL